ncbi:MAG: cobyrinic acid a,c-diamide synthase, partial [Kiloniellaceae bacterium]
GWRGAGAQVLPFSPLADEAPDPTADAVYLPGGYPELHGARLAASRRFLEGVRAAAARGAAVYGECGGYMVLGQALTDRAGARHPMAGLLPVETSFAHPRLSLGYREIEALAHGPLGAAGARFRGHEFHYAATVATAGSPLFRCRDGAGEALGQAGCRDGTVGGSFIHLIDAAA